MRLFDYLDKNLNWSLSYSLFISTLSNILRPMYDINLLKYTIKRYILKYNMICQFQPENIIYACVII